jgi:proteasome accessory factor B
VEGQAVPDSAERIVNLALYLASATAPVTAEACRVAVAGYPDRQDEAAFLRMFERDKEDLRTSGLVIEVVDVEGTEAYRLDQGASFAPPLHLDARQLAVLAVVGATFAADPSFPFREDLRLALAKLALGSGTATSSEAAAMRGLLADEDPEEQGRVVAVLAGAAERRKIATFSYTDAAGTGSDRTVEPWGLYVHDGRWYLVGRDRGVGEPRVFAAVRMRDVAVEPAKPKTPDFERPADFDVAKYARLPFQLGPASIRAEVLFAPEVAWRAQRLAAGAGRLESRPGGGALWHVDAADGDALLRWTVENGPGIEILAPAELRERMADALRRVVSAHGC